MTGYIGGTPTITLSNTGTLDLRDLDIGLYTTLNLSAAGNTLQLSHVQYGYVGPLDGSFRGIVNGGAGNDQVVFSGTHLIGTNTLNGNGGNDTLTGSSGYDIISGGTGADSLTGGAYRDTFVFALADGGTTDTITDFQFGVGGDYFRVTSALNGYIRYIGSDSFSVGAGGNSGAYTNRLPC